MKYEKMSCELAITLDIDWSPDFIMTEIEEILIKKKVKATWFVTHASSAIKQLENYSDLFELGIHPNFYEGSTHRKTSQQVFEYVFQLVPQGVTMRTHGLFQSSRLMQIAHETFGVKNDVSIFLPYVNDIYPHEIYYSPSHSPKTA